MTDEARKTDNEQSLLGDATSALWFKTVCFAWVAILVAGYALGTLLYTGSSGEDQYMRVATAIGASVSSASYLALPAIIGGASRFIKPNLVLGVAAIAVAGILFAL